MCIHYCCFKCIYSDINKYKTKLRLVNVKPEPWCTYKKKVSPFTLIPNIHSKKYY